MMINTRFFLNRFTLPVLLVSTLFTQIFSSRTIFIPRPITTDLTYELALSNYDIYHHRQCLEDRAFVNFYATPFYQKSRNGKDLARYFLPNGSRQLNIQENGLGNIGSLSLELISGPSTSFSSKIRINPTRRAFGSHFNFHFNLCCLTPGLWAGISFAAYKAEHSLNLCEFDLQNPGTLAGLQTATQALNNPTWCAGRLSNRRLSRTGIDDVQFKLGYDWYFCEDISHFGLYAVATAPTSKKSRGSLYLFEPVIGTRHASLGLGLNGDCNITSDCDSSLNFMFDARYRYLFRARERRSFDLTPNGDWSRYLQVVCAQNPLMSMPGINFLTLPVRVTPGSTFELWTALHYEICCFNFEVGYNYWFKQHEKVCLRCPISNNFGVLDIPGICSIRPTTSSNFAICQSIVGNTGTSDANFTAITARNINLESGTHPRSFTNKVYGAVSYNSEICCLPVLIGVGGSYEFAHRCSALENWAVWGKLGISF